MVKLFDRRGRGGFTLAELLVVVALVAILAGIVLRVMQGAASAGKSICELSFSSDGSRLCGAFTDGSVRVWSVPNGQLVASLPAIQASDVYVLHSAFSADGRLVASFYYDRPRGSEVLNVRDLLTGKEIFQKKDTSAFAFALSHDGKWLAVADAGSNSLSLIDVRQTYAEETIVGSLDDADFPQPMHPARLAFSPDDHEICYVSLAGKIVRWNLQTRQADRTQLKITPGSTFSPNWTTYSADGKIIAVAGDEYVFNIADRSIGLPEQFIALLDSNDLSALARQENDAETFKPVLFESSKPAFVALRYGAVEILDARTFEVLEQVPVRNHADAIAVSADGKQIAIADSEAIDLYDGNATRRIVDFRPSLAGLVLLFAAFGIALVALVGMCRQRKYRTCEKCGKRWLPRGKAAGSCCPDCGLAHLTTAELTRIYRHSQRQMWRPIIFVTVVSATVAAVFNPFAKGDETGWKSLAWICSAPFASMAALFFLFLALNYARRYRLRRWRSVDYSVAAARKAAGVEGVLERHGPITLWTDADAAPMAAATIAARLEEFRLRLAEVTGVEFEPAGPLCLLLFSRTQAANQFSLRLANDDLEQNVGYLGPWANLGYLSMEGTRRKLTPLEQAINSILVAHLMRASGNGVSLWLGLGLNMFVAYAGAPGERDSWRRVVGFWCREGTLLPLKAIFRRETLRYFCDSWAFMLPDLYEHRSKIFNELISLVDYFVGPDAPEERKLQFQRLWHAVRQQHSMERACRTALGYGLTQLDSHWKAWAVEARYGPPEMAPPEIVDAAEKDVLPRLRNSETPLQERIKIIRTLGASGWELGIEPLTQLFDDPQEDIRREARRGLELLRGGKVLRACEVQTSPHHRPLSPK